MSWIKRNLFFAVGSVVAVALLAGAVLYNLSAWHHNAAERERLNEAYAELNRLYQLEPNPGSRQVDNIKIAREQQQEIRAVLTKAASHFKPIPSIPGSPPKAAGRDKEFTDALASTVERLQREAADASVTLPQPAPGHSSYNFSFQAQSVRVVFAPGSLERLAEKLGEVRAICHVLFAAKINVLEGIRRERVSVDDEQNPSQSDYLDQKSKTTELATLVPYELSFRCFSSELASVLAGFAASPHGFVVKAINVEPAVPSEATMPSSAAMYGSPGAYNQPGYVSAGYGPGTPGYEPGAPGYAPPAPAPTMPSATASQTSRGGLPVVLKEKLLRVVMLVEVVKLTKR